MPKTILIVDDFVEYTNMLSSSLKTAGYEVLVANDGGASIRMAKEKKPDLIILDIMMPDVGGTEVRVELMKDPETKPIPIIFLTGLKAPLQKENHRHLSIPRVSKSEGLEGILKIIRETLAQEPAR